MPPSPTNEDPDTIDNWNREDAVDLDRPTDLSKYELTVSSRDWTVETIVQQVRQKNIDLEPAFQRRNAWRDQRRSRLIESFILGFPVPQIVLAENPRHRGKFIVIDGKQRLLTIAGVYLSEYRDYWAQHSFSGLDVLDTLNKVHLDNFLKEGRYESELRQLGNADIRTTIIAGFKDEGVLYDIFYRINTGSVPLSTQELRQVLNRGDFARYMLEVTASANPIWNILGIDSADSRLRDVELLLRLVAWRMFPKRYKGNMKPFLDSTMVELNKSWDRERQTIEKLVNELFAGIEMAMAVFGENAGRKYKNGRYERALNRSVFEVQAYYFSRPPVRKATTGKKKNIALAFKNLCGNAEFMASIESTTKSIENYRVRFSKYQEMLEKTLSITLLPLPLPPPGNPK